jgi:hypothetical protein
MPTYCIEISIELIQTLQTNKKLRDQHEIGNKEWIYYDELFTKNIEIVASFFNPKNEITELKKYACK